MGGTDDPEMAALLRAALGGDEKAYETFLGKAAALVRAYARRRIAHGGIDAEDIVQDTLLALHLKRHTWLTDAPVLPWLYAIARHKLIDTFRRRGQRVEIDIADIASSLPQPEMETVSNRDISRALDALAPGQKAVVAAISIDGQSIGDVARRLGMNETAVRVALHRGLAAIAKRFRQD